MVIRVIIHSEEKRVHECKLFNDEYEAIEWLNRKLEENNLNDGCTLASRDDIIAANMVIAEICDDCMNVGNCVYFDTLRTACLEGVKHQLELSMDEHDINIAYHSGDCTDGVKHVRSQEYISQQLAKFDKDAMIDILDNVGYAFDENDREDIEQLIVFEAAAQLVDEFM